ncbi:MAG: hypothetical protein JW809_18365 [Pirellulales bacterium]|nr:hypothetical protein [Pirellulales bacterium]
MGRFAIIYVTHSPCLSRHAVTHIKGEFFIALLPILARRSLDEPIGRQESLPEALALLRRLWDRVWAIKPELPAGKDWQPPALPGNGHLFSTLLLLRHLMKHIPAIHAFASEWQTRVNRHLAAPPSMPNAIDRMGLNPDWNQHPAWL